MCEKLVIDHRRLIAVTPYRMPRSGSRVSYYRNFKALFEKFAQMRFDAYVRQHAAKDDFIDPPFFAAAGLNRWSEGPTLCAG